MKSSVSVDQLFQALRSELALNWVAGRKGGGRKIELRHQEEARPLVGRLDPIHPSPVQVLDAADRAYLVGLGKNTRADTLARLFSGEIVVLVMAADREPDDVLCMEADRAGVPLLLSALPAEALMEQLHRRLAELLAQRVSLHGVFMEVLGEGLLITGPCGLGKSELALELVTRGHHLIADDVAEFIRQGDTLVGECPELLRDFMEVRGLGILNIRAMFGDGAIRTSKALAMVIHLEPATDESMLRVDRLFGTRRTRQLLGVAVVELSLAVAPGRNLAVLVESAVRDQIIRRGGYSAADDFIERQQRHIMEQGG